VRGKTFVTKKNTLNLIELDACNLNIIQRHKFTRHLAKCRGLRFASALRLLFIWTLIIGKPVVLAQQQNEPLTNAIDVISLPAEMASRSFKVSVTGVVTASDPTLNGRFFVQDSSGGVFVDNVNGPHLEAGELVEVSGITYAGAYAPTITAPTVRTIGTAPLPPAKHVSIEQLMSGTEDSQRIEISGIVRDARVNGSRLSIDLAAGGYRFRAYATIPADYQPQNLVGSQVRVRGTAAEAHNRSLRQLINVEIYIPNLADLVVEIPESINPFDKSEIPLNNLAQYRRDNSLGQRVHVRGVVTFQKTGDNMFLQDAVGGLQVKSRQLAFFSPGDVVEAVGYPSFENYLLVLQDAVFRKTQDPRVRVKPKPVSIEELQNGLHHAEYVSLTGKLIERTVRQGRRLNTTTLVLQGTNVTFTAEADDGQGQLELRTIPISSVVEVSGICLTEIDSDGKLRSFRILMQGPEDFRIIQKPSWLTPQRLLIGFAIVCSVLIVFVSWTVMVSRKNLALNVLIRERDKAQIELQQANDQLEERVRARTEQLEFQVTARKESELQFKAVLGERTRLAQELHDTVEQTLTGIALQLDIAAKLYAQNPTDALSHLELARNLMFRSQMEVRQSVWDLRCLVQEQFDLSSALLERARQVTSGTSIHVDLKIKGRVRALPEVVEENFLRIGQEALTNVVKHARATSVNIHLEFEPQQVVLRIQDNGHGFVPQNAAGPREGHFGLLGMSERIKRLGGQFNLVSVPDKGTTVQVAIQLDQPQETLLPGIVDQQYSHEETREDTHPDS
jgi:signal transduction histidine kinase